MKFLKFLLKLFVVILAIGVIGQLWPIVLLLIPVWWLYTNLFYKSEKFLSTLTIVTN
mgnify:CR=1 FL=1